MAEACLDERLAASIRANRSLEETVEEMVAVASREVLRLLRNFLPAPDAESLLKLEEYLLRLFAQVSAGLSALAVKRVCQTTSFASCASASVQQVPGETGCWRHKGLQQTEVRFLAGSCSGSFDRLRTTSRRPIWCAFAPVGAAGNAALAGEDEQAVDVIRYLKQGVHGGASPGLQSAVARQAARLASFEETSQVLSEEGCLMNPKTVRRIALGVGERALTQRTARVDAARKQVRFSNQFAGRRVVIGVDGGRLRIREGGVRGRRRRNGRRGFRAEWREPRLITAYLIDEKGKPLSGALSLSKGGLPPLYETTMGDADQAFRLLITELKLRGI